jgi:hypothetical protein
MRRDRDARVRAGDAVAVRRTHQGQLACSRSARSRLLPVGQPSPPGMRHGSLLLPQILELPCALRLHNSSAATGWRVEASGGLAVWSGHPTNRRTTRDCQTGLLPVVGFRVKQRAHLRLAVSGDGDVVDDSLHVGRAEPLKLASIGGTRVAVRISVASLQCSGGGRRTRRQGSRALRRRRAWAWLGCGSTGCDSGSDRQSDHNRWELHFCLLVDPLGQSVSVMVPGGARGVIFRTSTARSQTLAHAVQLTSMSRGIMSPPGCLLLHALSLSSHSCRVASRPEPVTHQVGCKNGQAQRDAGKNGYPPSGSEVLSSVG